MSCGKSGKSGKCGKSGKSGKCREHRTTLHLRGHMNSYIAPKMYTHIICIYMSVMLCKLLQQHAPHRHITPTHKTHTRHTQDRHKTDTRTETSDYLIL